MNIGVIITLILIGWHTANEIRFIQQIKQDKRKLPLKKKRRRNGFSIRLSKSEFQKIVEEINRILDEQVNKP